MEQQQFDTLVSKFEAELTTRYLYYTQFHAALCHCMRGAGISRTKMNDEIIEAFKHAICNVYHGGCEPEFDNEEAYEKWENFNMKAFMLVTEAKVKEASFNPMWHRKVEDVTLRTDDASPFVDKSIPYYILVDKNYGSAFDKSKLTRLTSKQYGLS